MYRKGLRTFAHNVLLAFAFPWLQRGGPKTHSAEAYPDALRRVSYYNADTDKRLKFLTNNFVLPALTIAQIYKSRWQVELFFDNSTWCTPSYVMEFQEPFALNRPLVGSR